jgi:hypothetical protein
VFHIQERTLYQDLEMLIFYHARILSVIKLKPTTYTAVGNTQLSLISLLNISACPATLKDVGKIEVEV